MLNPMPKKVMPLTILKLIQNQQVVINTQNGKMRLYQYHQTLIRDINQVQTSQTTSTVTTNGSMKITDVQTRQRMDIFVTGVVGRSR